MISDSVKHRIRECVKLIDLVREYGIELKRAGTSWKGLCPFHQEKTASFNVYEDSGVYKCYGCGKTGDIFALIMEMDGLTFPTAAKHLADRVGIPVAYDRQMDENDRWKVHVYQLNAKAVKWYEEALWASTEARDYVRRRGLAEAHARRWRLGYCPADGPLVAAKVAPDNQYYAFRAGLLGQSRDGKRYYEFFHGRIIFPIFDIRGRCVGFGGRSMDDSLPKYLNTNQNAIFSKKTVLYGIHEAHTAIRKSHEAVVVEGYTDVLACHANGVDNVVATLGTSLTDEHVKKLRGLADRVILLRDMDNAGQLAAERSVTTLINGGMDTIKVASLDCDKCKDADDYLKARGPHDLRAVLAAAAQPFDYRMACEQATTKHDTAPERKARIIRAMVKWICSIKDEILKIQYRRTLADRMNVPEAVLFAYTGKPPQGISAKRAAARKQDSPQLIAEHEILRWLLHRPEHLGLANGALNSESFIGEPERALAGGIRAVVEDAVFDTLPDNKFDFMRLVLTKLAGQSEAMELCMGLSEENPMGVMGQEAMMLSMMASLDRERIFHELADCEAEMEAATKAKDAAAQAKAAARQAAVRATLLARVKDRQPKNS